MDAPRNDGELRFHRDPKSSKEITVAIKKHESSEIIKKNQENMISVHGFACAVSKRGAHLNHHVRHI